MRSALLALMFSLPLSAALEPKPCPANLNNPSVRCGSLAVPENAANPGGRMIHLNIVIVNARNPSAVVPPLFHLDGGPGIAATTAADFYLGPGSGYRESRDIVLLDQRGTGDSNPLRCSALERRHPLREMYAGGEVAACLDDLRKRADLSQYSTEIAAEDIDRVRDALGYSQIDLWALSYGTRLAQVYMKRFPQRVHRAVLVGFVPLDYRAPLHHAAGAQRVLDLLFYKCQMDSACSTSYPLFRSDWQAVLARLERASSTIPRGPFAEALRTFIGTAAGQRQLPFMIHAAAAGDFDAFRGALPKDSSQFAEGLNLTIVCSEAVARIDSKDIRRRTSGTFLGDYRVRQERAACAQWPVYPVGEDFFAAPKITAPILVIAGEMDHVAPPDWGFHFCSELANCRFLLIPNFGHGPFDLDSWTDGGCFDDVAIAFYRDPASVDFSCVKRMRPPAFR